MLQAAASYSSIAVIDTGRLYSYDLYFVPGAVVLIEVLIFYSSALLVRVYI